MIRARAATVARIAVAMLAAGTITGAVLVIAPPTGRAEGDTVPLAPIVAAWAEYTVSGSKSEPLYTEYVTATRSGDTFAVAIDVLMQGDAAGGSQRDAVEVTAAGDIRWLVGCADDPATCEADPAVRGFLAPAAVLAAERRGELPATGVARTLHGIPVVCIADAELYPLSPGRAGLDPCFSWTTGALLGYWSAASAVFTGPTLGPDLRDRAVADPDLLTSVFP